MSYVKIRSSRSGRIRKNCIDRGSDKQLAGTYSIGVITNDIYTKEDAEFLDQKTVLMPKGKNYGS